MFRVSIIYPNSSGNKFDWQYYLEKHIVTVRKTLEGQGMVKSEVDRGIGSAQQGVPAPFIAIAHMYFDTVEAMQNCMSKGAVMMADVPNFTNIQPQIQISQIVT